MVGQHIETRRRALFRSRRKAAEGSGISEIVWRQIESGERQIAVGVIRPPNPERGTKEAVCARLLWTADSIDRLLRGETPIEIEASTPPAVQMDADIAERVSRLETQVADLAAKIDAALDVLPPGRPQDGRP